jgi:hypothetical protein
MTKYLLVATALPIIIQNSFIQYQLRNEQPKETTMAFRQHNPNVVPSRQKSGPSWNINKSNGISVPFQSGAKVSLPSFQQAIHHPREQTVLSDETSLYMGISSFSSDYYPRDGDENAENSTNLASVVSTSQPTGIYRIPTLSSNSLQPGIYKALRTSSPRPSPDPFRLEKLRRFSQNSNTGEVGGIERRAVPKPTGSTKYVEAARSSTTMPSTKSVAAPSLTIFKDDDMERSHEEQMHVVPSSNTVQAYVHKLHSLSDTGNSRSAKEAELLLLEMINKYKAGLHNFQPDGGCYNRYVIRLIELHGTDKTTWGWTLTYFSHYCKCDSCVCRSWATQSSRKCNAPNVCRLQKRK